MQVVDPETRVSIEYHLEWPNIQIRKKIAKKILCEMHKN